MIDHFLGVWRVVFLQMDANGRRRRGMLWYATCRLQVFQNVEGSVLTHWRFMFCWETRIDSNLDTLQGGPPILLYVGKPTIKPSYHR